MAQLPQQSVEYVVKQAPIVGNFVQAAEQEEQKFMSKEGEHRAKKALLWGFFGLLIAGPIGLVLGLLGFHFHDKKQQAAKAAAAQEKNGKWVEMPPLAKAVGHAVEQVPMLGKVVQAAEKMADQPQHVVHV